MRGGAESIVSCSLFLLGGTVILHADRLIFPPVGRAAAQMDVNILTFLCRRAEKWKKLYLTAEK